MATGSIPRSALLAPLKWHVVHQITNTKRRQKRPSLRGIPVMSDGYQDKIKSRTTSTENGVVMRNDQSTNQLADKILSPN
jgi:hypothetical protein